MSVSVATTREKAGCSGAAPGINPEDTPRLPGKKNLPLLPPDALRAQRLRQIFLRPIVAEFFPLRRMTTNAGVEHCAPAAVLIALIAPQDKVSGGGLEVLFTQRTPTLSTHAGQIAFPGGKIDTTDTGPSSCAVREAQEEVGLAPDFVEVLGSLPVYTTPRYAITPVVALVRHGFALTPNPAEVENIFTVPLSFLMNPRKHQRQTHKERSWYAMPYCEKNEKGTREYYIWGVSAGILRNFYHFLRYACAAH